MRTSTTLTAAAFLAVLTTAVTAKADVILEQYEFQGQPGTETSLAPTYVAPSLNGIAFGEAGVTPAAGANSINSQGWTNPQAAYTFGFAVARGHSATVNQLTLTSRSSGAGPGLLNVLASADGGAYVVVATITQSGSNYNDQFLSIGPVTGTSNLSFKIVAANQTSASGGVISATNTFRVGDYNPAGTPTPFSLYGTIATLGPASVPEPSTLALLVCAAAATLLASRIRIS